MASLNSFFFCFSCFLNWGGIAINQLWNKRQWFFQLDSVFYFHFIVIMQTEKQSEWCKDMKYVSAPLEKGKKKMKEKSPKRQENSKTCIPRRHFSESVKGWSYIPGSGINRYFFFFVEASFFISWVSSQRNFIFTGVQTMKAKHFATNLKKTICRKVKLC